MESTGEIAAVLSDTPAHDDKLDFEPYAKTVRDIILNPNVATPLTIGIFGSWGSGKSSLMQMIDDRLADELDHTIWFNAWVYGKEQALWRALITQVLQGVEKIYGADATVQDEVAKVLQQLYQATELTDLGSLSIAAADLLQERGTGSAQISLTLRRGLRLLDNVQASPDGADRGEIDPEKLKKLRQQVRREMAHLERGRIISLEEFRQKFSSLVERYFADKGTPVVVFVDDLDRCLPEKAVEVLEAIKLFLDAPGCIFILAIDQDVVERGIKLRYGELGIEGGNKKESNDKQDGVGIDGRRYLEKIIQIPFNLPPISRDSIARFIAQVAPELPDPECGQVFAVGLEPNPRQVKRSINIFSLLWSLSRHKSELSNLVSEVRLAKLVVLQQRFHTLYEALPDTPDLLIQWELAFRNSLEEKLAGEKETKRKTSWREWLDKLENRPQELEIYDLAVDDLAVLADLLTMHPNTDQFADWNFSSLQADDVKAYIFLTSTASTTGPSAGAPTPTLDTTATRPAASDEDTAPSSEARDEQAAPMDDGADEGEQSTVVVSIESGLDSSRRAFVEESTFGELDRFASFADVDRESGNLIMQNLAEAGSRFFDQVFGAYGRREELSADMADATTLRIPPTSGESQIPWEIVYDLLPEDSFARKKPFDIKDAKVSKDGFWGFRHIIERPLRWSVKASPVIHEGKVPRVHVNLDLDSPQQEMVAHQFEELTDKGVTTSQIFTSLDAFVSELSLEPAHVIVLHGRAGVDGGEAWIDFASEDASLEDRRELLKVLNDRFDSEELRVLTFELNLDYDDLSGMTKRDRARELIVYMERRSRLGELVDWIKVKRPDIAITRASLRLNRQMLSSWGATVPNTLLYLDVDAGIGRSTDWRNWLESLWNMGFGGVIVPLISPHPNWSVEFMMRFMDLYLKGGIGAGEALRDARNQFLAATGNPLGLSYAHFGPADQQLKFAPAI